MNYSLYPDITYVHMNCSEILQIYLLDSNLQILFAQERHNLSNKFYFHEMRQLISDSLHGNRSHIVIAW